MIARIAARAGCPKYPEERNRPSKLWVAAKTILQFRRRVPPPKDPIATFDVCRFRTFSSDDAAHANDSGTYCNHRPATTRGLFH